MNPDPAPSSYILGLHPHGVLPFGGMLALSYEAEGAENTLLVRSCYHHFLFSRCFGLIRATNTP